MGKDRNETPVYSRNMGLKYRASYSTDGVEYEGWAMKITAEEDDLLWQICKHTWSGGNLVQTNWANDSDDFSFSWTLKSDYF